jgi:hypothetical protein
MFQFMNLLYFLNLVFLCIFLNLFQVQANLCMHYGKRNQMGKGSLLQHIEQYIF